MQTTSSKDQKSTNAAEELLGQLFLHAKAQFGSAIKSFWFYDGELCPACNQHLIGVIKFKGKEALSLNAFIYRQRGVLIGYFLCESCNERIHRDAKKHPYTQTEVHANIERTLIDAYLSSEGKLSD